MARTVSSVIQQAREILQDVRAPFRYSNARLIGYLNTAISDARRLRPDLFLPNASAALPQYSDTDMEEEVPIDDMYFSALVDFVAGMTSSSDDEYAVEGRAVVLMNQFRAKLVGKGV